MRKKIATLVLWVAFVVVFFGSLMLYENPQTFSLLGARDVPLLNAVAILYGG